ncbi:MAG: BatA domain-containing protein, partial [Clostridia bacterium]
MGAAVVLMHTLRMRRREREVSSLFLWQLASRAMAADHRRHRLIKSLILLVQLLVIELLAAALAGPQFHRNGAAVHLGVIVDTSASMAAGSGETRAGEAVAALERFLSEGEAARYILWSTTGTLLRYDG